MPMAIEALHVGFTVANVREMAEFMSCCFGFETTEPRRPLPESIAEITGIEGAEVEIVYVVAPGITMEFLQYLSPASATTSGGRPCDLGASHLALKVPDVAQVVQQAAAYGFVPAARHLPKMMAGPNCGMRATYLRDRHGFTIELMGS